MAKIQDEGLTNAIDANPHTCRVIIEVNNASFTHFKKSIEREKHQPTSSACESTKLALTFKPPGV
jgi:hypothetical protein